MVAMIGSSSAAMASMSSAPEQVHVPSSPLSVGVAVGETVESVVECSVGAIDPVFDGPMVIWILLTMTIVGA